MSEREDGGKREWLKASGKRMNKARTKCEILQDGGSSFFFDLAFPYYQGQV